MSYYNIYNLRLNRYGSNYQERIQSKREKEFELYLARSVYRVVFSHEGEEFVGSFEKYRQDETETLHYLLVPINVNFNPGDILDIPNKDGVEKPWMVYYLENIKASGYNRYVMLKMSHFLVWTARDGSTKISWAYMYGQQNNMLKDELKSRSRMSTLYNENLKSSFFILPRNKYIRKDDYFVIGQTEPVLYRLKSIKRERLKDSDLLNLLIIEYGNKPDFELEEYYRVTGYDIQSSLGVEYVTVDPVYKYDLSEAPEQTPEDSPEDFYWLNGGISNGS